MNKMSVPKRKNHMLGQSYELDGGGVTEKGEV